MKHSNIKKILLVDDSETNRLLVKNIFDEKEFEVFVAACGKDGLNLLKTQVIDIIILDIMMPEMDGFEFLEEIRKNCKTAKIPVVMLTAKSNHATIKKAQEQGVKDYIIKPLDIDDLILRVKRILK